MQDIFISSFFLFGKKVSLILKLSYCNLDESQIFRFIINIQIKKGQFQTIKNYILYLKCYFLMYDISDKLMTLKKYYPLNSSNILYIKYSIKT